MTKILRKFDKNRYGRTHARPTRKNRTNNDDSLWRLKKNVNFDKNRKNRELLGQLSQKNRKLFPVHKSSLIFLGVKSSIFITILLYNVGFLRISECLTHLERFLQIIFDFLEFSRGF